MTCVKAAVKTSGEFVVKPSRQKTTLNMARGELGSPPLYARLVLTVSTSVFQTEGGSSNLLSCSKTLHKKVKRGDFLNTENKIQKVGKYKVDVANVTNQAIRYVKSNPCCICSCENFCPIKYKGTCKIWVNLKSALFSVDEVKE